MLKPFLASVACSAVLCPFLKKRGQQVVESVWKSCSCHLSEDAQGLAGANFLTVGLPVS